MNPKTETAMSHGNPLFLEFLEAGAGGRLLVRWCTGCDRPHWYPRNICPRCFSDATQWRESAGLGEIYAFSVMRRAEKVYVIAYVRLDEGVTMMTNIQTNDPDEVRIGQRVKAVFCGPDQFGGLPIFHLA